MLIKKCALFLWVLSVHSCLVSEILQKEGEGFLEKKEGQLILHLKGTPYEMGYQHGVLLKPMIQKMVSIFIDGEKSEFVQKRFDEFLDAYPTVLDHIPKKYREEMVGLSKGSGVTIRKIELLNLFPEMFHCSGIVALPAATEDHDLYHARVLDYRAAMGIEKTAVLMAVEPSEGFRFINVSYPGFVGSVTGMNAQKISIGEIGGLGYGKWDGCPMSFLIRSALETSSSLEEAKQVFATTKRTCEYYYLIADGNEKTAVAVYATPSQIRFVEPGASYALVPSNGTSEGENMVITPFSLKSAEGRFTLYGSNNEVKGLFFEQPEDSLLFTGFPKPERFSVLFERFVKNWGAFNLQKMQELIKPPVTCETNIHNAIFQPTQLKVSIAHKKEDKPASEQTYNTYSFESLFNLK